MIDSLGRINYKLKLSTVKSVSYISILLTAANISNNIVGAGIITLPKALKDSGIGVGILFLAISTIMCGWTFTMMAVCGEFCKTTTYEKTVQKLLGKPGYYAVIICTILFPISSAIAYGITIAANLQSFFMGIFPEYSFYKNRALLMLAPYYFIIFPLTLIKDMKFLERFSTFSIILVLFYVSTIFWKLNSIPYVIQTLPGTFVFGKLTAFKALPVFAFACSCHHNVISFYKSLKDRSIKNFVISKNIAFNFSFVIYIAVAISGFITFGGQPLDNIFENYCSNDILMNITRLIFTVTLLLTSPLQLFAPRQVITQNVLVKFSNSKWIHAVTTFILISVCYVTVVLIDNIGVVIEIGGAITNVPI
ncbi:hypothetical protein HZS_407, partial [Henneguya salminicola]